MVFPVWMWELDCEESWAPNNWCFWAVVLEKTLENPLDSKEIQPVHPKGNHSWVFIGRTDVETNSKILAIWWKDLSQLKRHWCWGKLKVEGEGDSRGWDGWMASLTQWHEFDQTLGDGEGQGSLASCSPWGHKGSDTTEQLNNKWERAP